MGLVIRSFTPSHPPAMDKPDEADDHSSFERQTDQRVGPSTMMLEGGNRAFEQPQYIEIGRLGRERHGQRSVGRLAIEAGTPQAGSGQEVGDGFQVVCRILIGARGKRQSRWLSIVCN